MLSNYLRLVAYSTKGQYAGGLARATVKVLESEFRFLSNALQWPVAH